MIRCTSCNAVFDLPVKNAYQERVDGFPCTLYELTCPSCGLGEQHFEDVEECQYCGGWKREGADMCDECHDNLMRRWADDLRAIRKKYDKTELDAIDYQLDGVHIGDFMQRYGKKG